jgi:hypothetical protein
VVILKKGGTLLNGRAVRSTIWHAVKLWNIYRGPALCGAQPKLKWAEPNGGTVTCRLCRRILAARATRHFK